MELNKELLQLAIDLCKQHGAKDVMVKVIQNDEHQIRYSNSQIDILKQWLDDSIDILATRGKHVKILTIQNPTESKLKNTIPKALKSLKSEPKSILYWGIEKKRKIYPQSPDLVDPDIANFIGKAPDYVNAAIQSSFEIGSKKVAGALYFGKKMTGVLTSNGNGGIYSSSYYRMTIRSFFDAESSGQDIIAGRSLKNIEKKFTSAGRNSGKIAKMSVDGVQGSAGKYDLILSPTVAANLFGELVSGANPLMILAGMSTVGGSVGQQIGPDNLTIIDDPTHPEGIGSYPFDFEGTPAQPTPIIENGKLVNLLQNTSTAKIWSLLGMIGKGKVGTKTTGNCDMGYIMMEGIGPKGIFPNPSNFVYKPGDFSLPEMIAESKKPTIYLTSNWYTRYTSQLEGKFSTIPRDGSFLIENGEIKHAIRKIRLSDNLLRICSNVSAIGKDLQQIQWWEVATPTFIPYIKVKDCNITTATE